MIDHLLQPANDTQDELLSSARSMAADIASSCGDQDDPHAKLAEAIKRSDHSPHFWAAVMRAMDKLLSYHSMD